MVNYLNRVSDQNIQKLLFFAGFASYIASILNLRSPFSSHHSNILSLNIFGLCIDGRIYYRNIPDAQIYTSVPDFIEINETSMWLEIAKWLLGHHLDLILYSVAFLAPFRFQTLNSLYIYVLYLDFFFFLMLLFCKGWLLKDSHLAAPCSFSFQSIYTFAKLC